MAKPAHSSSNWIFALKVLLISTGALSSILILKLSVPLIVDFLVSRVPELWISIRLWLTPPYLYLVINGIILTIAASSGLHNKLQEKPERVVPEKPIEIRSDFEIPAGYDGVVKSPVVELPGFEVPTETSPESEVLTGEVYDDSDFISRSNWSPKRRDSLGFSPEKPLASVRFQRKNVKASPEAGKALRVTKSRRNETLESTWKNITDGRPIPLARHLKKSDTWETHNRPRSDDGSPLLKKSDTVNDRNNAAESSPSPASGKLRKEPSLGQDDLNRRVEAFIKRFNEEIRLQRQESLQHYVEMVNRGSE